MTKKRCTKCNKLLDIKKFNSYLVKSGEIRYRNTCGICRGSKYYTEVNARKRANYDPLLKAIYYLKNKAPITKRTSQRHIERRKEDPLYKLADTLRTRTAKALKRQSFKKTTKFSQYIGCTLEELKFHLEKQFQSGMTWDNHGKWHIDHIIPLSSAKTEEEMYKLLYYTNLQPLWALDNIKKGAKIIAPQDMIRSCEKSP